MNFDWEFTVKILDAEGTGPSQVTEDSSFRMVGAHDLLIVGPGVLGRLVAQRWKTVKFWICIVFVFL